MAWDKEHSPSPGHLDLYVRHGIACQPPNACNYPTCSSEPLGKLHAARGHIKGAKLHPKTQCKAPTGDVK